MTTGAVPGAGLHPRAPRLVMKMTTGITGVRPRADMKTRMTAVVVPAAAAGRAAGTAIRKVTPALRAAAATAGMEAGTTMMMAAAGMAIRKATRKPRAVAGKAAAANAAGVGAAMMTTMMIGHTGRSR